MDPWNVINMNEEVARLFNVCSYSQKIVLAGGVVRTQFVRVCVPFIRM
jgi:hypothetical protein